MHDCILETSECISSVRSQDFGKLWGVERIGNGLKTGAFKVLMTFCFLTWVTNVLTLQNSSDGTLMICVLFVCELCFKKNTFIFYFIF